MAVPSAVIKQREKLQAELGLKPDGTPVETPPAEPALTLVESSTPTTPESTPPAAPDAAQARIKELENLLRTRDGQTSTAQREANDAKTKLEIFQTQVQALEEAVAELTKQKETAEARADAKQADGDLPSLDDPGELSPQELEVFGTDSVGFVKKLSKRELISYIKPLMAKISAMERSLARLSDLDKLPQLEKTVQTAEANAQRVREEEFFRKEVLHYFNDFETVREQPEWKAYLTEDIPDRGIKIGHLLNQYRLMHNSSGIRSVLQTYYDRMEKKPGLSSLAVPSKTQTEGTPLTKPKMKASEYKANLRAFTQKRLDRTAWDAFKAEFETARREGRVEMDENL